VRNSVLSAFLTVWCTWRISLGLHICCPGCTNWGITGGRGNLPSPQTKNSLGPAVAPGMKRREASKVNAARKLTIYSWLAQLLVYIQHQP
jgi:hypothetical protein